MERNFIHLSNMNQKLHILLDNKVLRDILLLISTHRPYIRQDKLSEFAKINTQDLNKIIQNLEFNNFIKIKEAPIPELRLIYLTVSGLSASSKFSTFLKKIL
jgi:hypothetical protein